MNEARNHAMHEPRASVAHTRPIICLLVAVALALLQTTASAQESGDSTPRPSNPEALRLLDEGYRLYEAGDFEKAIEAYKRGAKIEPGPRFHFNLGQCFRRLRRYDQAIFHFERVAADPRVSATVRQYAETFIQDMKNEMAAAASSNPPTGPAESLDGAPGPDQQPLGDTHDTASHGDVPKDRPVRWYRDRVGWSLTAVASVALLTGIGLEIRASSLYAEAERETDQDEILSLEDRARTHKIWGLVALGVGGATLAAGITRLALTPDTKDSRSPARVTLSVGGSWIGISGRF